MNKRYCTLPPRDAGGDEKQNDAYRCVLWAADRGAAPDRIDLLRRRGIQTIAAGALRGVNDTWILLVIAIISYRLIGFAAAHVPAFGVVGVWIGLAIGTAYMRPCSSCASTCTQTDWRRDDRLIDHVGSAA